MLKADDLSQVHEAHLNTESSNVLRELATNHRLLASTLYEMGKYQEAYEEYKKSARFYETLIKQESTNSLYHRDMFVSLYNAGLMLERLNDQQGACKEYVNSIRFARKAAELDRQWASLTQNAESRSKALNCLE